MFDPFIVFISAVLCLWTLAMALICVFLGLIWKAVSEAAPAADLPSQSLYGANTGLKRGSVNATEADVQALRQINEKLDQRRVLETSVESGDSSLDNLAEESAMEDDLDTNIEKLRGIR